MHNIFYKKDIDELAKQAGITKKQANAFANFLISLVNSNLATKPDLEVQKLELQKEIQKNKSELQREIQKNKAELQKEIQETKAELQKEIQETKAELQKEIQEIKAELHKEIHKSMWITIGLTVSSIGLILALFKFIS